jgi:hypothetical protein
MTITFLFRFLATACVSAWAVDDAAGAGDGGRVHR